MRNIPVMIEVKGLKGSFIKLNNQGEIDNKKADGTPNYSNINKFISKIDEINLTEEERENKVAPLEIIDLKGEQGEKSNDGITIINKIESFLSERNLPNERKK